MAESFIPDARRTFKAYSVWAHDVITLCTCDAADKLFVGVFRWVYFEIIGSRPLLNTINLLLASMDVSGRYDNVLVVGKLQSSFLGVAAWSEALTTYAAGPTADL